MDQSDFVMWEKDNNRWARQEVPRSGYRDVLRDKLEDTQIEFLLYQ